MAKDQCIRMPNLIVEELTEILHIHFAFLSINDRNGSVQHRIRNRGIFHRTHNVRKLSYAGRLNQNAVGMVRFGNLRQSTPEISHQRAANTAGIDLIHRHSRILQESTVNTDFSKFVFNQHQLFVTISTTDQFFDQSGFTGAEEAGKHVNLRHNNFPSQIF